MPLIFRRTQLARNERIAVYLHDLNSRSVVIKLTQFRTVRNVLIGVQVLCNDRFNFFNFEWLQVIGHVLDFRFVAVASAIGRGPIVGVRRRRRRRKGWTQWWWWSCSCGCCTGRRLRQLFTQFLIGSRLHHGFTLVLCHDPTLLHSDAEAALHAAELAALSVGQGNEALALVTALKVQVVDVLNGSTEKGLARVARQAAKVVALGIVTTYATVLDPFFLILL